MQSPEDLYLRLVLQRAKNAEVFIEGRSCGRLASGILVFLGLGQKPSAKPWPLMPEEALTEATCAAFAPIRDRLLDKILGLRIFEDAEGKMNLSPLARGGGIYLVSQFTLFADMKKGFRPSFGKAAPAAVAQRVFEDFKEHLRRRSQSEGASFPFFHGEFAAQMEVHLCNDGPVTLILEADAKGFL
jgi:D-aminoacyl-tRNA deacylase